MVASSAEGVVSIGLGDLESLDLQRLTWVNECLPLVAFTKFQIGKFTGPLQLVDRPAHFNPALVLSARFNGEAFMFACSEAWLDMLLESLDVSWSSLSATVRQLIVQKAVGPIGEFFAGFQIVGSESFGQMSSANELFLATGYETEAWLGLQCASAIRADVLSKVFSKYMVSREVSPLVALPISLPLVAAQIMIPAAELDALAVGDVLPC